MTQTTAREGRGRHHLRTLSLALCISLMGLGGPAFAEPAKTSNVKRAPRAAAQQATSSSVVHRTSLGTERSTRGEPNVSPSVFSPAAAPTLSKHFGHLPLSFERNDRQVDSTVQFLARGKGYTLFLTPSEAVLAMRTAEGLSRSGVELSAGDSTKPTEQTRQTESTRQTEQTSGTVLRMKFDGANSNTDMRGTEIPPVTKEH